MASNVTPFVISAPGFFGLNTQDSPTDMSTNFSLDATNCVIDKYGRIGSRKGWVKANTTNTDLGTGDVTCIGELIEPGGTVTTLAAGNGFLFKLSAGTLVTLTYGGGGVAPTISANNWQFCQLNGIAVFFQRGYDPLIYDPAVSTTTFRRLSEKAGYTGTVPQANCAVSAYGRIWCADTSSNKNTVTWSDTKTTHLWTGGTSGTLDLIGVWPQGGDEIVALAAHNNKLIIFGRKQTLIYSGASTPSTMALSDSLSNMGCLARDSVQNTGDDLIFLSSVGVHSLQRTIQENSAPTRGLSANVANEIQGYIALDNMENVKSGYSPTEGFYIVTFPASAITYCFDMRHPLQDGSSRTTLWSGIPSKCFANTKAGLFYMGKPGYIGTYSGYLDNTSTYRLSYYTTWQDLGNPVQTSILKKIIMTLVGASNQTVVFKWGFDFIGLQFTAYATLDALAEVSEYGIAEYGIGEYQGSSIVVPTSTQAGGSGKVIQIGVEAEVNGNQVSVQKLEIFTKEGRV